jgi:anti-sigma B factor antagonist
MEIIQSFVQNIPVLALSGKIDAVTSKELEFALNGFMEKNINSLVIDFHGVEYISSSGLRILLTSLDKLKKNQGDLKLASLQPLVKEIFEITGINQFFSIYPSQEDAIKGSQP